MKAARSGDRKSPADGSQDLVIAQASQALFRLGRLFGRQSLRERLAATPPELSRLMVVQALAEGEAHGHATTIGDLARVLALDPSTASRLVTVCLRDGYLERVASPRDGRTVLLSLTPAGRSLAAQARNWQQEVFATATRDWSEAERDAFARSFVRFATALDGLMHEE